MGCGCEGLVVWSVDVAVVGKSISEYCGSGVSVIGVLGCGGLSSCLWKVA